MRFLRLLRFVRGINGSDQPALPPRQKFVIRVIAGKEEFSLPGLDRFQGLTFDDQGEAEAYCRSANRLYSYERYVVVDANR
jgi:hypothetical protein